MIRSLCTQTMQRLQLVPNMCSRPCFYIPSLLPERWKCYLRDDLGQTTIFVQEGLDIQEVPAIVRKTENLFLISESTGDGDNGSPDSGSGSLESAAPRRRFREMEEKELKEMMNGFGRCHQPKDVFGLLETMPAEEVVPSVALYALKKLIELENNWEFRNLARLFPEFDESHHETFTRAAVVKQLMDIICCSEEPKVLLEGLRCMGREMHSGDGQTYQKRICDAILVQVTEGKFNLPEICQAVQMLAHLEGTGRAREQTDKLWVGIVDKQGDINENNLALLAETLPCFKQSQNLVFTVIQKKVLELWWQLKGASVASMLEVFCSINCASQRILSCFAKWLNVNIHVVTEAELLCILKNFYTAKYFDENIAKAMERYMKAKAIKIQDVSLVAMMMNYCQKFRLRNQYILEGAGEFFISEGHRCSAIHINAILCALGHLDFHPPNGFRFWQVLEEQLETKFVQFQPSDAVNLLLSCVFLHKYPLNQMKKVLNPFFLDRLHQERDPQLLERARMKLKILDVSMAMECRHYQGPVLPRDVGAKSIWHDGRILRTINHLQEPLSALLGGPDRFSSCVVLSHLPLASLYIVDILLHPTRALPLKAGLKANNTSLVALLINLPEHYCHEKTHLVGMQVMRNRQLKIMGFKVVGVNYEEVAAMKMHPRRLQKYLKGKLGLDGNYL